MRNNSFWKTVLLTALISHNILSAGLCAFAQEGQSAKKGAVGLGLEWNMHSYENFAGGAVLGLDFNLPHSFALGLTVTYSNNFSGLSVVEPAALLRWYVIVKDHTGFFVQADAGTFLVFDEGELISSTFPLPFFLGGLRVGYRIPIGSSFFIEPYGRGGYPFLFGIGVTAGVRF